MDTITVGLQFGDEGKGSIVDYLADEKSVVIRYNGASQAAHHVVTPSGTTHCFSQFGSGTFRKGSLTYLSRFMLIDPLAILAENDVLKTQGITDGLDRLYINKDCPIITPFHRILNQMHEVATDHRKGSCGMGVGEAVRDLTWMKSLALVAEDLLSPENLYRKLNFLWKQKVDVAEQILIEHPDTSELKSLFNQLTAENHLSLLYEEFNKFGKENASHIVENLPKELQNRNVIFEGAQGVLLDQKFGFDPFITKSNTTLVNADHLFENTFSREANNLGIIRAYTTRHGPGPLPTEDPLLGKMIPEIHNGNNDWQRDFRYGWFDLVLAKYALCVLDSEIDSLAITNVDRLNYFHSVSVCTSYIIENPPDNLEDYFSCQREGGYAKITGINVLTNHDSDHQKELTKLLFRCIPVYQNFPGWKSVDDDNLNRYLEFITKELNTPIKIVSFGPTRNDKRQLN